MTKYMNFGIISPSEYCYYSEFVVEVLKYFKISAAMNAVGMNSSPSELIFTPYFEDYVEIIKF